MKSEMVEALDLILGALPKGKGYAAYWDWPDKPVKEFAVVRELLISQVEKEGASWIRPRSLKSNEVRNAAPDCIGLDIGRRLIGFEVTELVDQITLEINQRGPYEIKEWSENEFINQIKSRLDSKDGKRLVGGPFHKYVVVLHTDEPLLRHEECSAFLRGHEFGPFLKIDEAFLIFAPEPAQVSSSVCPFIRLQTYKAK